jgi:hypothetical protein
MKKISQYWPTSARDNDPLKVFLIAFKMGKQW